MSSHHDVGLTHALSTEEAVWLLGSLAGLHRKPFDAELLIKRFAPPWDLPTLIEALAGLGLKALPIPWPDPAHPHPPLPAVAFARGTAPDTGGPPLLVARRGDGQLGVFRPGDPPAELDDLHTLREAVQPWLLLCAPQDPAAPAGPDEDGGTQATSTPEGAAAARQRQGFGFAWFIPELLRHRRLWRDVLLASLAIQLVGLATPLFTQVIMRMDALSTEADLNALGTERWRKRLALRRLDAELAEQALRITPDDPPPLAQEATAQQLANQAALASALAEERSRMLKAQQELAAAQQQSQRLQAVMPHFQAQETAYVQLADQGFTGQLMVSDKRRERIEKEQELATQQHVIASARASTDQSVKKLEQIRAEHRQRLHSERAETRSQLERLEADWQKQQHRHALMELRAPHEGIVKELATHTVGTVVQPGTVLATLVPQQAPLKVEVWVSNDDIGFVRPGQPVKLKFAAYPFQKYGMAHGEVQWVNADAQVEEPGRGAAEAGHPPPRYKATVTLREAELVRDDRRHTLTAGMQAQAEILLGQRTVMEYLLSPVQRAWHEAGRER